MKQIDPYEVLEIEPGASMLEITKAYKRLSKKWHPDKNKDSEKSKERMIDINLAYESLKDGGNTGRSNSSTNSLWDMVAGIWEEFQRFDWASHYNDQGFTSIDEFAEYFANVKVNQKTRYNGLDDFFSSIAQEGSLLEDYARAIVLYRETRDAGTADEERLKQAKTHILSSMQNTVVHYLDASKIHYAVEICYLAEVFTEEEKDSAKEVSDMQDMIFEKYKSKISDELKMDVWFAFSTYNELKEFLDGNQSYHERVLEIKHSMLNKILETMKDQESLEFPHRLYPIAESIAEGDVDDPGVWSALGCMKRYIGI